MSKLYIVRHGETDWNRKGLLQGIKDIDINEKGIKEATLLAQKIDLKKIDLCLSSPLKRAKKTAEILTQGQIKIRYDDLLKERNYGLLEGKPLQEELVKREWDYNLNDDTYNIETIKDCLQRAEQFLAKVKREYPHKNILIVSHGSFIKALHFALTGYDEKTNFLAFNPQNTTLYTYILK